MKNKTLRRMLLPIGLLLVNGISFTNHFAKVDVSDFTDGFLKGIGIALMLLGVFFMRTCNKTVTAFNE